MSLTSLFLSLVLFPLRTNPLTGLKAKPAPRLKTARELELEDELRRATFALSYWRTSWHDLWAENERLRAQRVSPAPDAQLTQETLLLHLNALNARLRSNCSPARASLLKPDALEC